MHTLEVAVKNIIAGKPHIVVAERQDQVVGVFWTRNPHQHLANLSEATLLGRIEVRPSMHASSLVARLAKYFEFSTTARSNESFWTIADFEEVLAALSEWDLERGVRIERAGVRANDRVYVQNVGRGTVKGFTRCGRVEVVLDRPYSHATVTAFAPRSQVKPIIRAPSQ